MTLYSERGFPLYPTRFNLETESSSLQSNDQPAEEDVTQDDGEEGEAKGGSAEEVFGEKEEEEKDTIRPPKIWISKSASMEHDLD